MQRKTEVWAIAGFMVVLVVAVIAAGFLSTKISPPQANFKATTVPPLSASDWVRSSNPQAKVSLIEYGDFQCPACGQYEPLVEQLMSQYGDRVLFSFRNFPLFQIHQDAMISAQAAEAAGLQGKYWEMHDLLYKTQNEWSLTSADAVVTKYFDGYAKTLGLDVAKFDADINSDTVKNKIQRDIDSANAAEVDHTPTFFINLTQIPNPTSYADFAAAIDAALASSTVSQ